MPKTPDPNDETTAPETETATPISATSAASGGATGMSVNDTTQPSLVRRHPFATGVAAGVLAVVLVSGLTAWGVGTAVAGSLTSSAGSEMPMSMPTSSTSSPTSAPMTTAPGGKAGAATTGRLAFRATIQAMDTHSWTILTKQGKTVTVTIDSTTQFGTKKSAATATSFTVGDSVLILATPGSDAPPIATRVVQRMF